MLSFIERAHQTNFSELAFGGQATACGDCSTRARCKSICAVNRLMSIMMLFDEPRTSALVGTELRHGVLISF